MQSDLQYGLGFLRVRLIELVREKIILPENHTVLGSFGELAKTIRIAKELRRVIARARNGHGKMAPGVPEMLTGIEKELATAGVL